MSSVNDDRSDDSATEELRRKKHKKREHKRKRHHTSTSGYASSSSSDSQEGNRRKNKARHAHATEDRKKKRKERESSSSKRRSKSKKRSRRDSYHDSSSDSSCSDARGDRDETRTRRRDRDRDRSRDHKHKRKHSLHRKDRRKRDKDRDRDRDRGREKRHEKDPPTTASQRKQHTPASSVPSKYQSFLLLLHQLLAKHPALATELPYMLIRISSGSSIHLSQVPDASVAKGLRQIFQTLGCTCTASNDEWKFDDDGRMKQNSTGDNSTNELVLIKLVRYLMDEMGFTMDAVEQFENGGNMDDAKKAGAETTSRTHETKNPTPDIHAEICSLTTMLLEKYQSQQKDKKSSLAKELYDIIQMIAEKEIICLDAIPDESLRDAMEKLFNIIGLSREEMEDESDDDDENGSDGPNGRGGNSNAIGRDKGISYGYVLPEEAEDQFNWIKTKLDAAETACKAVHQKNIQKNALKRTLGPSLPPQGASENVSAFDLQNSSEEEEDDVGPAPLGEMTAKRRNRKSPAMSSVALKEMVKEREAQMIHATTGVDPNASAIAGEREEWMMQPGEHDFLKGVLSKGIKNRTFKNEKGKAVEAAVDAPLDPKIQKQVDNIIKMHEEARGPSLIEQHRQKRAEEKLAAKKGNGNDWSWNRDADLDSGRRVDKSHLQMVMGGASKDLKNKFQGTYTKSFT